MTCIKDSTFPDRMRVKFLSDIPIEPDEIEYLIELAEDPDRPDCQCACEACSDCHQG
jgi:hypothetical protein